MIRPVIAKRETTLHILQAFGIRAAKKLGQNFLIDPGVVGQIVAAAEITSEDRVLEIGPGIGTLTQGLAETGAKITAVEIDDRLLPVLAKTLEGYDNISIIHGDVLKIDIQGAMGLGGYKVVANLPYYITTPIIMRLLEEGLPMERLVTMVQKEVAERMVAKPGGKDYGALSVAVQYYSEPEIIKVVSSRSFIPEPAVESAVVRCVIRKTPPVDIKSEKLFFRVVKAAFGQRRKTLHNALKGGGVPEAVLAQTDIDGKRRGETLSLEEFAMLANSWHSLMQQ